MKKTIFVFAAIFSFAVLFTACKETKKGEVKEEVKIENHEDHDHEKGEMASEGVYQCPMNCEKGKTYDKVGSCPVCKMDLKLMSGDKEDVKYTNVCKCKEDGGECKCEPGKCQCKVAVATSGDMCKCKDGGECKCESGKCECKA